MNGSLIEEGSACKLGGRIDSDHVLSDRVEKDVRGNPVRTFSSDR